MTKKIYFQKRNITDNHAFSKLDFYRRCASLMKSKDINMLNSIKSEFEKQLSIGSPYVFYSNDHGWCINTEIVIDIFKEVAKNVY